MSASLKLALVPDDATRDLWRVAETDDVDELARILRRAGNVNARNEHGMTALMRAAHHGHAHMVRALLDHGADPNLTRNDKFTALALAAFFGHTETVRILIEHGAKTEVVTRCGASARTWATVRTFKEAARCLELHSSATATAAAPAPVQSAVVQSAVVKSLRDPPEIWDLVHEVPRGFNARSAFVSRIKSMKRSFALGIAAVLVISVGCLVGALALRGSEAHTLPAPPSEPPQNQVAIEKEVSPPASTQPIASDPAPQPVVENAKLSSSRKTQFVPRPTKPVPIVVAESVESKEVSAAPAAVIATPRVETRSTTKANTPPSPQLIAPAKSVPPKAKVIQWP